MLTYHRSKTNHCVLF